MIHAKDYALTICEKPDAARKIAHAIGSEECRTVRVGGVEFHVANDGKRTYVVCSALGHMYTIEDLTANRKVYPVFDVEWIPLKSKRVHSILNVVGKLARNASSFINACDYDQEGEVIGYNILKYACNNKHDKAFRAKFSTLTDDELRDAFASMQQGISDGLARAGRTRHMLDFLYGVNLSRALSQSFYRISRRFRNLTIGRVQGPTLSFVVEREITIRSHVPVPFWEIAAKFVKNDQVFDAYYAYGRIYRLAEAEQIVLACKGRDGRVDDLKGMTIEQKPPAPFNLGDLQHEAFRLFHFSPSYTLSIAEKLYLDALVSYPRTSSQKLKSKSVNYRRIVQNISRINAYSMAGELLRGRMVPHEGSKDDPAHPAIHPTGEYPKRRLAGVEWKLYDLIVKRFLSTFGEPASVNRNEVLIDVNGYKFRANGRNIMQEGWMLYYNPYVNLHEIKLPELRVNERVENREVKSTQEFTKPPARYNQASLLERMESENIGTKATRSEIIRTLLERGYMNESIEPTELGFAVVECLRTYAPDIVSTELTREIERGLDEVESMLSDDRCVKDAVTKLKNTLSVFKSKENEIGREMRRALAQTAIAQNVIGSCPLCKDGHLRIIRSKQSGKRFAGCSNFGKGCKGSMPLPQKGAVRKSKSPCKICKWPIVYVRFASRKYAWKLCININCPGKKKSNQ